MRLVDEWQQCLSKRLALSASIARKPVEEIDSLRDEQLGRAWLRQASDQVEDALDHLVDTAWDTNPGRLRGHAQLPRLRAYDDVFLA